MSRRSGFALLPPRFERHLEAKYRVRDTDQAIRYHRIAAPLGAFLYLGYAAWDLVLSPSTAESILMIRLGGALVLGLFFLATYTEVYRRHERFLTGCLALFFGTNVAWILRVNQLGFATNGVAGILVVLMIFATAFRLRPTAALLSSLGTCVFAHWLMVDEGLSNRLVLANDVHLAAGTIIGIVFTWLNEFYNRRTFVLEFQLVEQQRRTNELAEQVRAATETRIQWLERFAGFLRHELKNQLVGIRSSIDLAKRTSSTGQLGEPYLSRAHHSAEVMQRLLSAATEAASLEAALTTHEFDRIDLATIVRERCAEFQAVVGARSVHVFADEAVGVSGDEARLVQLLDKLLSNACDHGTVGSPITVRVAATNAQAILELNNEGKLPADTSRLFEPFHSEARGPSASENLGIGLYVAKLIVESHGGTILAEQSASNEVSLRVELPLA